MAERKLRTARIVSVIAATVISLACGTNYAYSAWAPAFADRLKLSSTQSNLIGTFGNLGMYTAGIPVGLLVDNRGPRPGALFGAVTIGIGYLSIFRGKYVYRLILATLMIGTAYQGGPDSIAMPWLCFFAYLTGIGGCAAFAGAIKTSALNWPNYRGTATAFPLSAFGLSAFFFSTISYVAFPDNTSDLLLLLAIGTFAMILVGTLFLRVVPNSPTYTPIYDTDEGRGTDSPTMLRRAKSEEAKENDRRLSSERGTQPENIPYNGGAHTDSKRFDDSVGPSSVTEETSSLLSKSTGSSPGDMQRVSEHDSQHVDIRGLALLSTTKFYQLWLLLGLLTGIGLMTINNIGSDARAIWRHYDDSASLEFIQERQLMHVELLSLGSFCGRLISGIGSDVIVRMLGMSRFWCLFVSSCIFLVAQICGARVENPHVLGFVSGLTGLGYGFLFGVYPSLVAETFGVNGLSQNWGCMTLAPIVFGNLFNLIYGHIYDRHSIILPDGLRDCRDGLYCYQSAYFVTVAASLVGIGVSLWSVHHDWVGKVKRRMERDRGHEA